MTIQLHMKQDDQVLRLLAHMYARWFMCTRSEPMLEAYEQIRDVFYTVLNQRDAYEQLAHLAEASATDGFPRNVYERARDTIAYVIQMGGHTDALIVGETDGYRHLCLTCSRDEDNFHRVGFFNQRERRPLLKPEVEGEHRSIYSRCQLCLQPINPTTLVLFVLTGTQKHAKGCHCRTCNRANIASVLTIYACDAEAQQVLFPALHHISAPSRPQCVELAIKLCWEKGWYMFNKNPARS